MEPNTKAVLLVGGKGTRLRSVVSSVPKPLAAVGNRSFLELLVRQLRHEGVRNLVFCTGYLADQIHNQFGDGRRWDVAIEYSREEQPLGTAGALRLAQRFLDKSIPFLVMNGDSFIEIDFSDLLSFHYRHAALASMVVAPVANAERYGTVEIDARHRVVGFREKTGIQTSGQINAGVYVFDDRIFDHIPEGPASLERDVFCRVLNRGVYAFESRGMFIDIGIPEDYARAQAICDRLDDAAFRRS